ncbi:hypothetical protein TTRE_0000484901 [Trichuris trichiura]|uniref:Uncharacterized protein n=1 Tax=Trichuris trichiura TaxID=36087 RepID=A0A077Z9W8_TRITR|nr:hypothetical protein TTRE_0000484901 [Trichuris trichiura]
MCSSEKPICDEEFSCCNVMLIIEDYNHEIIGTVREGEPIVEPPKPSESSSDENPPTPAPTPSPPSPEPEEPISEGRPEFKQQGYQDINDTVGYAIEHNGICGADYTIIEYEHPGTGFFIQTDSSDIYDKKLISRGYKKNGASFYIWKA